MSSGQRFGECLSNIFNRIWQFIKKIFAYNPAPNQRREDTSSHSSDTERTLKARTRKRASDDQSDSNQDSPAFGIHSRLLEQRIVFLGSEIDDDVTNSLVAQLLYLESKDPKKDINLYINSSGGSVTCGMAIFDTMTQISPDVCTVCTGLAGGIATLLLTAGAKGKRFSLPNARIVLIQPMAGYDQDTYLEVQAREIVEITDLIHGILARHTGQSQAKIEADIRKETHLSATEALKYGLIDRVIEQPALTRE
jgi:ATP-dependent Clp protease, protease subunit